MPRKQPVQFTAAGTVAATDRVVLQQGAVSTPLTHATLGQVIGLSHPTLDVTGNATVGGAIVQTPAGTISAAGTSQATATALTAQLSVVTTVSAGQGVVLPSFNATILNRGTVSLLVYPPTGAQIEAYGTNAAVELAANTGAADFLRISSTLYRVF